MTIIYEKEQIETVIRELRAGKVIAFPTDTVYGLGVCYDDEDALQRLKAAKGRPENKPIPTMVGNRRQLAEVAAVNETIERLADAFLPGALTLILRRRAQVADYVTNGLDTIGVRMPDDPFVLALIDGLGKPMLVTSANRSGEKTGTTFEEVMEQLDGRIDGIVRGTCGCLSASTIIDVSQEEVRLLREGPISREAIDQVLAKA
ncbi:MAG TPA: threonylcarbamoyl-AMP synthase [Candidatus Merdibacter merdigallinarum]|nr:threonylcarbamoyl-AMP synthase [Candidatus Merdibacter merdigallinarum]